MIKPSVSEQMKRRNDLLKDMMELITYEFVQHGFAEDKAKEAAERVALGIHENFRGLTIAFPMNPELIRQRLKAQVLSEFRGDNIRELVKKYNLAENTIYVWIAEDYKRRKDESQHKLDL